MRVLDIIGWASIAVAAASMVADQIAGDGQVPAWLALGLVLVAAAYLGSAGASDLARDLIARDRDEWRRRALIAWSKLGAPTPKEPDQ